MDINNLFTIWFDFLTDDFFILVFTWKFIIVFFYAIIYRLI